MSGTGVVVVGPAPPLRGGISAHTARLVEHLGSSGGGASALSYRRLYPSLLFPGRDQRHGSNRPDWVREDLDVLDPAAARHALAGFDGDVVVQWWHPVVAAAVLAAVRDVPAARLAVVVHNARPHEWFPAAGPALRALLRRAGRVVCHGEAEAARVRGGRAFGLAGRPGPDVLVAPLPCLVSAADLEAGAGRPAPPGLPPGARVFVAAGHLRAYKGTLDLVAAWSSARRPANAVLALVGESYLDAGDHRRLLACCAKDPSIVLVDRYVDDVEFVSWLTAAEAVLAPYAAASQSGTLPLAAALGVPAVVSDAGGLPAQAGPGSSVVRAGDREALRLALEHRFDLGLAVDVAARRRAASQEAAAFSLRWARVVEALGVGRRP